MAKAPKPLTKSEIVDHLAKTVEGVTKKTNKKKSTKKSNKKKGRKKRDLSKYDNEDMRD